MHITSPQNPNPSILIFNTKDNTSLKSEFIANIIRYLPLKDMSFAIRRFKKNITLKRDYDTKIITKGLGINHSVFSML